MSVILRQLKFRVLIGYFKVGPPVGCFQSTLLIGIFKLRFSISFTNYSFLLAISGQETRLFIGSFKVRLSVGSVFSRVVFGVLPLDKTLWEKPASVVIFSFFLFSKQMCSMERRFLLIKTWKIDWKVKEGATSSLKCSHYLIFSSFSPKQPNDCLPAN